jgi:hypothetical protein
MPKLIYNTLRSNNLQDIVISDYVTDTKIKSKSVWEIHYYMNEKFTLDTNKTNKKPMGVNKSLTWMKNSPGASSVPARKLPIMTVDAPKDNALTTCPELAIPPSAMIGTPIALPTAAVL